MPLWKIIIENKKKSQRDRENVVSNPSYTISNLYSSPNFIMIAESRRLQLGRYVTETE
jgi:hypothetical protein